MKTILPVSLHPDTTVKEASPLTADELATLPFFAGLDRRLLEAIAPHTKQAHFAAGAEILSQGDAADRFYVLESGRVRLSCRLPDLQLHVEEIGPGKVVGFSWLFTPEKVHFTARALEPVTAVFVYGTLLQSEFSDEPKLGYELALRMGKVLLERLEAVVGFLGETRIVEG